MGFQDGRRFEREGYEESDRGIDRFVREEAMAPFVALSKRKPKRKLSAWNSTLRISATT